jgi:hypothetical protein
MTIPESQYILDAFDWASCDMGCYFPAPPTTYSLTMALEDKSTPDRRSREQ